MPHGPRERPLIEESLAKGPAQFLCVLMGFQGAYGTIFICVSTLSTNKKM